ncbi:PIG-L family deacetylase [Flavobacterium silvaticum]|uniref:PIG-L family deacetylase n=1 Tax=Flavobacterium silvaticum TaxID=1852020 RepID=A0A972FPA8_9FLAO|nr:PIG-L family deacetylase [Flavobacterium silvaticum]NMH28915.1 PIG-L family deacetylase [Flavobacterium silvaticum]
MHKHFYIPVFLLLFVVSVQSQPAKPNSAEIHSRIQKLNFLGSVLYIAAHPDDENTRLITWLANDKKARTAYLSLTRGDGGQNLIGPQLRELLGVIRTQELLEARKIDGGIQYFSRANDFGYSKNPDETLAIWNKDEVLQDIVKVIREFRPDVIINRFDARTPGSTHGHHTSSAILSLEAFDLAGKESSFPQLMKLPAWQPKRLYMNTSWWFYGSKEKFDKADKTNLIKISTGTFYPEFGKSNQEIAALSRSSHKSQGFGSSGVRGQDEEYLEFLKGEKSNGSTDLFYGIDTSWNRVAGGKAIGELIEKIEKQYDYSHPEKSVTDLVKAYNMISAIKDEYWKTIKLSEVKEIIAACTGLFLEAVSMTGQASPGDLVTVKAEAINRSSVPMQLKSITTTPASEGPTPAPLDANTDKSIDLKLTIPADFSFTQPYWLVKQGTVGMYKVDDASLIGKPESPRQAKAVFTVDILGTSLDFERQIVYKFNDDVKGEVYTPFDIVPQVTISLSDRNMFFSSNEPRTFHVKVVGEKVPAKGKLMLSAGKDWKISPSAIDFSIDKKDGIADFSFTVTPPPSASESTLDCVAIIGNDTLRADKITIDYPHIKRQLVFKESKARLIKPEIVIGNQKIAYIMGAGDEVPDCLRQMGYAVTLIAPEEISAPRLKQFNVVITGIRAYNTIKELALHQAELLDFVNNGGTMIVQYNTLDDLVAPDMSPYKLKLSRDRVTREDCEVKFIDPKNPILNYPNKITEKDFNGWVQERGLYFPNEWDSAFKPVISMKDTGESAKESSILVASYGKGTYIYTGLSFFRELPEGVTGAYRLMANLISASNSKNP